MSLTRLQKAGYRYVRTGAFVCLAALFFCIPVLKTSSADVSHLSFASAKDLTRSMIEALAPATTPTQLLQLERILRQPDDPSVTVSSLDELRSALPLPAQTIIRLLNQLKRSMPHQPAATEADFRVYESQASLGVMPTSSLQHNSPNLHKHLPAKTGQTGVSIDVYQLALQAAFRQLVWDSGLRAVSDPASHSALPVPPTTPLPPLPPVSPLATSIGGVGSVTALSPIASIAVAGSAVAVGAGMSSSGGGGETSPASSSGGGGGNDGGGSDDNLDTSVWETDEYNRAWGLAAINASTAYARGYTGDGVTVSVLDSPFDTDHSEFTGQLTTAYDGMDGDSSVSCPVMGCVSSHGTHVAGTIGARKDDTGMHGVAPDVTIKPVKIFGNDLSFVTTSQLVSAIAEGSGTAITAMNNSWGASTIDTLTHNGTPYYYKRPYFNYPSTNSSEVSLSSAEQTAWQTATQDTIIVFANGNDGLNTETGRIALYTDSATETFSHYADNTATDVNANIPSFRGSLPSVESSLTGEWLTVVALDNTNTIASFSNGCGYARDFCIAAPGVAIYSTYDVDDNSSPSPVSYKNLQGTSMAAPHVTGAIALLKEQFPNLTPTQLTSLVLSTATDLGATGVDDVYGAGMLNLAEASQPQGTVAISGRQGDALEGTTIENTSLRTSSVFGTALFHSDIRLGVTDDYERSYVWQPAVSRSEKRYRFTEDDILALLAHAPTEPVFQTARMQMISGSSDGRSQSETEWLELSYTTPAISLSAGGGDVKTSYRMAEYSGFPSVLSGAGFTQLRDMKVNLKYVSSEWALSPYIWLGSSIISGRWDEGQDFTEISSEIKWQVEGASLASRMGLLDEKNSVLGAAFSGYYDVLKTRSTFISLSAEHPIGNHFKMGSTYQVLTSQVQTRYPDLFSIDGLVSDRYQLFVDNSDLYSSGTASRLSLSLPLATTSGRFSQVTTKGYLQDGSYRTVRDEFSLKNPARQIDMNFTQRGQLTTGGDWMVMMRASQNTDGVKGSDDAGIYFGMTHDF